MPARSIAASGLDVAPRRSRSRPPRTVPRSRAVATNAAAAASSNGTRHPRASASASPMTGATANPIPNAATRTALPQTRATPVPGTPSAAEAGSGSPRGSPAAHASADGDRARQARQCEADAEARDQPADDHHPHRRRKTADERPGGEQGTADGQQVKRPTSTPIYRAGCSRPHHRRPQAAKHEQGVQRGFAQVGDDLGGDRPDEGQLQSREAGQQDWRQPCSPGRDRAGDTSCGRTSRSGVEACIDQVSPPKGDLAVAPLRRAWTTATRPETVAGCHHRLPDRRLQGRHFDGNRLSCAFTPTAIAFLCGARAMARVRERRRGIRAPGEVAAA